MIQATVDEVIEYVRSLPVEEQDRVRAALREPGEDTTDRIRKALQPFADAGEITLGSGRLPPREPQAYDGPPLSADIIRDRR